MSTEIKNPILICLFIFGIILFICSIIRVVNINYNDILFYAIIISSVVISFIIIQVLYFRIVTFSINYMFK